MKHWLLSFGFVWLLQACAPAYLSSYQSPPEGGPDALLQSTRVKIGFLGPVEAVPQIRAINGRLISPRDEETWKLTPYAEFRIPVGDTFVEVQHGRNGDAGYVRFRAETGEIYALSYQENPGGRMFVLRVQDRQGRLIDRRSFRKMQWDKYVYSKQQDALLDAIVENDRATVEQLLKAGVDPNGIDGNTSLNALLVAVRENNTGMLALLISAGVWVDGPQGARALATAAALGEEDILRMLLEHGADPNLRQLGRDTALMRAASQGHAGVVGLLLEQGAYTEFRNLQGKTALDLARESGHDAVVGLLARSHD